MDLRIKIILALQGAMIGNISQHVRLICCDWHNLDWFKLVFYIDVHQNENENELMSVILTEFESNMRGFNIQFNKYYEEMIFSNESFDVLNKLKLIAYWRNELPVF